MSFVERNKILYNSWHFIRQQLLWLNSQPIFVALWIMETMSSEFSSILQKRFDTVDHGFSLHKLHRYRIQWYANDFLRSCLTNRTQHTYANGVRSDVQSSICGVYQGSVMGTLFLCYIHKCSNRLSYQCQAFPAHCFWVLALAVWIFFLVKLSFEMLTFLTHERMFLGKVSKVYRQKMSQPEGDSNP